MKNRRLVAALACRSGGARLYGKPLQNLDIKNEVTILDHLIIGMKACGLIDEIVLGISEGSENQIFVEYARKHNIQYIFGSQKDVLFRLIQCGRVANATDVFRVTSECPFIAWEFLPRAWEAHLAENNDVTVTDYMSEGVNFEIYKISALEQSHVSGDDYDRSEFCSSYIRRHPEAFKIDIIEPPSILKRLDLRLTVDYPEDLILCRAIYENLKHACPHIPIEKIIKFIDKNPEVHKLVEQYVDTNPIWASVVKYEKA